MTSTGGWRPAERVAALLFVDFDGLAADPEDVISDGLDGGYRSRTEALREVLRDPAESPADRFLACAALTRWGDPDGYEAVVRAAGAPERVAWRGASYDRFHGRDDTFGVLADAVGQSVDMVEERGTAAQRTRAAEALLSIVDQVPFGLRVSALLSRDLVVACLETVQATVSRGTTRLEAQPPCCDLGLQLALMIRAAHRIAPDWAEDAADRLRAARPGGRALRELPTGGEVECGSARSAVMMPGDDGGF
ncbi:hypothetical protein [Streptomyces sp. WAC00469]|uniref:hypothetical protein n=1 Tax=Streptomyces sp. WAC00469 TaxID=2487415 RepID=UPI000F741B8C|nr:hypothetical protein [Streptomyces sp. WAC00469]